MNAETSSKASFYRHRIAALNADLTEAQSHLSNIVHECERQGHAWGEPVYDPIRQPEIHDQGDTPGTMGVDFRARTIRQHRWTRTCKNCGHTQFTVGPISSESHTKAVPTGKSPVFGGRT